MPLRLKNKDIPPQAHDKTAMPAPPKQPEAQTRENSVNCPACGYSFITGTNGKRKLRTRVLVFTENGNTMGICPKCKVNLKVPVMLAGVVLEVRGNP